MISLKDAKELAKTIGSTLLATDVRFRRVVYLTDHCGSSLVYQPAFALRHGSYVLVFTEHHGYHVYHEEDLSFYAQYEDLLIDPVPEFFLEGLEDQKVAPNEY